MFRDSSTLSVEQEALPPRLGAPFEDTTGTAVLIGRLIDFVGAPDALLMLYDRLVAHAASRGGALRVVPAADLSEWELDYAGVRRTAVRIAVGASVAAARVDKGVSAPFTLAAARAAELRAAELLDASFWHDVARGLDPIAAGALLGARTETWGIPYGPLSSGGVVWGVPRAADEPVPDGLGRLIGRDAELRPFSIAVQGAIAGWGTDWTPFRLDLGDAAHASRTSRAAPGAAYYVVPRFG